MVCGKQASHGSLVRPVGFGSHLALIRRFSIALSFRALGSSGEAGWMNKRSGILPPFVPANVNTSEVFLAPRPRSAESSWSTWPMSGFFERRPILMPNCAGRTQPFVFADSGVKPHFMINGRETVLDPLPTTISRRRSWPVVRRRRCIVNALDASEPRLALTMITGIIASA
jgi:hypothetical protein